MKQLIWISLFYSGVTFATSRPVHETKSGTMQVQGRAIDFITESIDSGAFQIIEGGPTLAVIAPAKKFLKEEKLFSDLSNELANRGYFVVRFDWGFSKLGLEPDVNLSREMNELDAVLNKFSAEKFMNKANPIIVAKSFGTKVLAKMKSKPLAAVALVTPNCDDKETFDHVYASFFKLQIPTHISISNDDPYCDVNQIYRSLGSLDKKNVWIQTSFGDHNFVTKGGNTQFRDRTVEMLADWFFQVTHYRAKNK